MLLASDDGVELFCAHAYSDPSEFPLYQLIIREKGRGTGGKHNLL